MLGVLATIWLALALHPCAMAYTKYETPKASAQHNCPHCPQSSTSDDQCELTQWQQTHASPVSLPVDGSVPPVATLTSFVALSLWQPDSAGLPPPLLERINLHPSPPLTRQDQLRL